MTHDDILAVEYYDQLDAAERREWCENTLDYCDDPQAVAAECDRIDAGLKAHCLS